MLAPSRGRGLKRRATFGPLRSQRRPLTGARIETRYLIRWMHATTRRPLTGARIETTSMPRSADIEESPPHGGAD